MLLDDIDSDGVVIVRLKRTAKQVDIRIQKSVEIEDDTVRAMAENAVEMLSVFMLLTKSEQRRFIENCNNIKSVTDSGNRHTLTVVKS